MKGQYCHCLSKYLLRMRIKTSDIFYKRYKSCYHRIHISMLGACVIRSGFWWSGSSKLSLMPGSAAASSNQGPCFPSLHPEQSVVISWPWSGQRTRLKNSVQCIHGWYHTHIFSRGVVHRVENGWGLTKVAAVLLNGLLW